MVIINSKDEDLSFLKDQATTGPGIATIMSNNVPPVVITVPSPATLTYKGDNNNLALQQQQQQQQLQKQLQQQLNQSFLNNNAKNNNNSLINNNALQQQQPLPPVAQQQQPQFAKAILLCRPQSHPFNKRTLRLEPNQEVKVGRAVARNKVCETNAIFECKVLSRNHAVIWYGNGRFFIKDTGSSNGTFINNHRLSEASFASEPYEVNSGDVVQFGVEVVENERKDTHGCIIATLKLYLPDGPETKTRQADTKVSAADLYRLNQYMQEAVKREHILETKLLNLQKNIQMTRKNSANNWQAMIDEDRLLSRIDYLEKKLQYFEKNVVEDKLKEDVVKLLEDKGEYQNSAKEALRKVYQERQDAVQKLTALERALITSDDECSSLRDQLTKTQQQLTDLTNELCQLHTQFEEKCGEVDEVKRKAGMESLASHHRISELQFELENCEQHQMSTRLNVVADWLSKSDIKKNKGSEDIIKAICNDNDDNMEGETTNMMNKCVQIFEKLAALEKFLNSVPHMTENKTIKGEIVDMSSPKSVNNQIDGSAEEKTDPTGPEPSPNCDDNQNNTKEANATEKQQENSILSPADSANLKKNFTEMMDLFNGLMQQLAQMQKTVQQSNSNENKMVAFVHTPETNTLIDSASSDCSADDVSVVFVGSTVNNDDDDDDTTIATTSEELESQLISLKLDLETRPTFKDYQDKLKSIDDLNETIAMARLESRNLRAQLDTNMTSMKNLENELQHLKMPPKVHTDAAEKDTDMEKDSKKVDACLQTDLDATTATPPAASDDVDNNNSRLIEELQIINHPAMEQEEELILYKEKYSNLSTEKSRLEEQLQKLRLDYDNYKNKSLANLILYLSPIIAIISYLMFYYLMK